jgi:hypothetical protein
MQADAAAPHQCHCFSRATWRLLGNGVIRRDHGIGEDTGALQWHMIWHLTQVDTRSFHVLGEASVQAEAVSTDLLAQGKASFWPLTHRRSIVLRYDLLPKSAIYAYCSPWRNDGTWQHRRHALRGDVRTP